MIVPGVAVDTTHRIFTLANLVDGLGRGERPRERLRHARPQPGGRTIRFRSPAYPGRVFEGEVIYAGDLVEEKSRTVKLLAGRENPDRLLKPGMFVEVEVLSPARATASQVPASALLTQGSRTFVFVRSGPDRFVRREVEAEPPRGETVVGPRAASSPATRSSSRAAFKLKALAVQHATAPSPESPGGGGIARVRLPDRLLAQEPGVRPPAAPRPGRLGRLLAAAACRSTPCPTSPTSR